MNSISKQDEVHPMSEGEFSFPTAGGRVRLSVTDDALTPYGGLVPWAAYTKHIGIVEQLAHISRLHSTSAKVSPQRISYVISNAGLVIVPSSLGLPSNLTHFAVESMDLTH